MLLTNFLLKSAKMGAAIAFAVFALPAGAATADSCFSAFAVESLKNETFTSQKIESSIPTLKEVTEKIKSLIQQLAAESTTQIGPKSKLLSQELIATVYNHLKNIGVKTNFVRDLDADMDVLQISPVDPAKNPRVHPLNRMAFRIQKRFQYTLIFSPWDLHQFKAAGFCRTQRKILGVSYNMVVSGRVDSVMIHEIRHMYQDHLAEKASTLGIGNAVQSAEFRPLPNGSLPFQVEGYSKYLRLDEAMSHVGDLIYNSYSMRKKNLYLQKAEQTLSLIESLLGSYDLNRSNLKAILSYQNAARFWGRLSKASSEPKEEEASLKAEIQQTDQKVAEMEVLKKTVVSAIQSEKLELDRLTKQTFPKAPMKVGLLRKIANELEQAYRWSEVLDSSQWNIYNHVSAVRLSKLPDAHPLVLTLPIISRDRKVNLVFLAYLRENSVGKNEIVYQYVFSNSKPIDGPGYMIQLVVTDSVLVSNFKNQMEALTIRGAEDYLQNHGKMQTSNAPRFQEVYDHATKMMERMGTMGKRMNLVLNKLDQSISQQDPTNYTKNLRELRAVLLQTYYPQ
jgi:hypothetical protein